MDIMNIIKDKAYSEWKYKISSRTKGSFNKELNHSIPPKTPWVKMSNFNSNDTRIILRLRTGYTFDKKFKALIRIENTNQCDVCKVLENFEHIFNNCVKFNHIRDKYKALKNSIREILKNAKTNELQEVLNSIKKQI